MWPYGLLVRILEFLSFLCQNKGSQGVMWLNSSLEIIYIEQGIRGYKLIMVSIHMFDIKEECIYYIYITLCIV